MIKRKIRKSKRQWYTAALFLCMCIMLAGGIWYISNLRVNLEEQAIENVLTVTKQQQQAFDNFISLDRERLHSFAKYFALYASDDTELIREWLTAFGEVDAFYSVINLDTGQYCGNKSDQVYEMGTDILEGYRALLGSGVREPYRSLYTDEQMFGYYERFTFADGVPGLIQKSYDCTKVSQTFSLSFYNDQGFAYVVNQKGNILVRSVGMLGDHIYKNIFDVLTGHDAEEAMIAEFMRALDRQGAGSLVVKGSGRNYVYTYVPIENVSEWYLVSIVPEDVITSETDRILRNSQMVMAYLAGTLIICVVLILLIRHTRKDIQDREWEIGYQEQLFDIFAAYLANNTDDIYMLIDAREHQVEYISPNAERILGISAQSITADLKPFTENLHVQGDRIDFGRLNALEPGMSLEAAQAEWANPKTGEKKWFQMSIYGTLVQDERKIVAYISDRTKEREVQNTLSEALQIAQVANNAKSSFLSSVSHDIRTPMNAITGFVTLLKAEADNPDAVRDYTQRIDAASQHLLGLINDVLDMNKIESGNATLHISDLNLTDIIEEINAIIRPQAKAKSQSFEIFSFSVNHENLQGDKLRINQILINLLSNAVKYTPEGGNIRMRVEELPQVLENYCRIRFVVSDNGMGMSEEYQKVIFDPFTREDNEISSQIQGTGLGMAITKSLVDLMDGTIQVRSEVGRGSEFTVELELYIREKENADTFWADFGIRRIIVTDDDEAVCLDIVRSMKETGVATDYATDGKTAVRMMRRAREEGHPYDLVLLDWKMPDLDGLGTVRLIRKNYPEKIPVLLFTAYDWGEIGQEAAGIGVNHFMPKPFFMTTFRNSIRRLMENEPKSGPESNQEVVKGKHILVVDDVKANQLVLTKILGTLGAECEVAGNGKEAVEMFENSPAGAYDLILMDVSMPVLDGYAATRAIRASAHPLAGSVPIIAMTANAFADDVRLAMEAGMDAHIAKPVQLEKMKAVIRQVFDSKKEQET